MDDEEETLAEALPTNIGLSDIERRNLVLIGALYFVQTVPLCFAWVPIPILLRQQLSYSDVGTFGFSYYPYSLKIIWSPVVEAFYIPKLGRRKSWLVPCFILVGIVLFWLGLNQDRLVTRVANGEYIGMVLLLLAWLLVMYLSSNIRIAIDSWSLDLMTQPNIHWVSTAVALGETSACFVSFNLFLGLSSFNLTRTPDGREEPASTRFFLTFWSMAFMVIAMSILLFKKEQKSTTKHSLRGSYTIIWRIVTMPQVWTLMLVHMTSMIGVMTNDTVTVLQLVKNGFSDRDIASLATISFPFEMLCGGILIGKLIKTRHPLAVWRMLFPYRLMSAVLSQFGVLAISSRYKESHYRWLIAILPYCFSKFGEMSMFVCLVAFHAQIADPQYGGIYLPLLATTLNVRYDTLGVLFVKTIGLLDGGEDLKEPTRLIDGYQIVNTVTVLMAIPIFLFFLKPATLYLQSLDPMTWRIGDSVMNKEYEMVSTRDDTTPDEEEDQNGFRSQ